eukprot:7427644-Karenia_brevis.AAC.1
MQQRQAAEEHERARLASLQAESLRGAYVSSPPRATVPPVAAKPVAKSQIRAAAKAAAEAVPSTAAWLGTLDSSDSPSDASQEVESPIDPSSLNDTGSSFRNMGPTPFVEDHVEVQQGEQIFLKSATIGAYQMLGITSFKLWVSIQFNSRV